MKKLDLFVALLVTVILLACFAYTMLTPSGLNTTFLIGA